MGVNSFKKTTTGTFANSKSIYDVMGERSVKNILIEFYTFKFFGCIEVYTLKFFDCIFSDIPFSVTNFSCIPSPSPNKLVCIFTRRKREDLYFYPKGGGEKKKTSVHISITSIESNQSNACSIILSKYGPILFQVFIMLAKHIYFYFYHYNGKDSF